MLRVFLAPSPLRVAKYGHGRRLISRSNLSSVIAPRIRCQFMSSARSTAQDSKLNTLPSPPNLRVLEGPADWVEAKKWVDHFKEKSIPRGLVELTFSRSSGPGGQNVNKVNTKTTLRCSANADWIPLWAREGILRSPQYVSSTKSILITSTVYRSQAQNIDDCLKKLHALILSHASASIKNPTPEETKKRVEGHVRAEKERNRKAKSLRSSVKQFRGKGSTKGWD